MSTYTDATLDFDSSHKPTLDISWDRKRPLLKVESLNKFYGDTQVLHDISLQIKPGEIIGLVGPNGAGKTTLMETLYGGQPFEAGLVRLFGEDVRQGLNHVIKQQLGVVPQSFSLPSLLRVEEIISLYQVLYTDALSVKQLLDIVALKAQRKMRFSRLSGGQKRRLVLALALAGKPKLLLLDEPTSDLDPQSRRYIWRHIIANSRQSGTGVLIATHQMDEAENLCDRVMIINHGRLLENASPQQLIERYCPGHHIRFSVPLTSVDEFLALFPEATQESDEHDQTFRRLHIPTQELAQVLPQVIALSQRLGCEPEQMQVSKNTLEDVFIHLTGEALRD
ncbi:ABC transporter ATP-binding protein [Serratia ureilytica]|uniref:ABC transporter ATP-binding protein n=1 Tax=Serratia ureilytica TaxID=300181 RepID=UPI0018A791AC|nr:ABC transporter ATP-binding protein [Serratia ureilytica]MBF4188702.1 ABC transporter ATP-binding protein [Serratia ureilytica]MBF8440761.1 ABC transporter ATP-binding protein [Serratia ureilytica]MBF8446957.1 ABC transporter ATP-binding protein [Serratia ureilytica]